MKDDVGLTEDGDLAFFGKVSASISHELKNILAIISETAGLLTDLVGISAKGGSLDPESILSCSDDIVAEIQRGFTVIKGMNRFAHSVDEPRATVDLAELAELTGRMVELLSFTGHVRVRSTNGSVSVDTRPFRLQHLMYRLLIAIFRAEGPRGKVEIEITADEGGGGTILFSGFEQLDTGILSETPVPSLASSLGVEVHLVDSGRSLCLRVRPLSDTGIAG
jgi:signal transduction histidine kinase